MPTAKTGGAKAQFPFVHNDFNRIENNHASQKKWIPVVFCPCDEIFTIEAYGVVLADCAIDGANESWLLWLMAEFKFFCPQCKQHIQCDSSYAGLKINCPSCQREIVVPPMPSVVQPKEPAIQIKTSTLRKAAIIALCVALAAGIVAAPFYIFVGPKKLTFKAYVDGTDIVKLSGGRLWIEHQTWQLPTRMTVNDKKWNPAWNNNVCKPFQLRRAFKPGNPQDIKLTSQRGRGGISILEKPSPANNETLAIKVDDGGFGGADWYEFAVSW